MKKRADEGIGLISKDMDEGEPEEITSDLPRKDHITEAWGWRPKTK